MSYLVPPVREVRTDILKTKQISDLSSECQETGTVWQEVVVDIDTGVASLVQKLQVTGVNGECLIVGSADQLAVADIVGPGGA